MAGVAEDIMEGMTDSELISRAEALGISASYVNWRGERVDVPADTLRAIIDAIGAPAGSLTSADDTTGVDEGGRRAAARCTAASDLGVHRPAVLGPLPPLLGSRRPARPR